MSGIALDFLAIHFAISEGFQSAKYRAALQYNVFSAKAGIFALRETPLKLWTQFGHRQTKKAPRFPT